MPVEMHRLGGRDEDSVGALRGRGRDWSQLCDLDTSNKRPHSALKTHGLVKRAPAIGVL